MITGAAHGIGRRTADVLAERGCALALNDIYTFKATRLSVSSPGIPVLAAAGDASGKTRLTGSRGRVDALTGRFRSVSAWWKAAGPLARDLQPSLIPGPLCRRECLQEIPDKFPVERRRCHTHMPPGLITRRDENVFQFANPFCRYTEQP